MPSFSERNTTTKPGPIILEKSSVFLMSKLPQDIRSTNREGCGVAVDVRFPHTLTYGGFWAEALNLVPIKGPEDKFYLRIRVFVRNPPLRGTFSRSIVGELSRTTCWPIIGSSPGAGRLENTTRGFEDISKQRELIGGIRDWSVRYHFILAFTSTSPFTIVHGWLGILPSF